MPNKISVGVIDSGFNADQTAAVADSARFVLQDQQLWQYETVADQLEHGSNVIDALLSQTDHADLHVAQVFTERFVTTPVQVAAAIEWLLEQSVQLINLSLGLSADRQVLRQAIDKAQQQGVIIVASTPSHGAPVFPAAYDGVLRATGDARCQKGQVSWLDCAYADVGGCVETVAGERAGASIANGYISGALVNHLAAAGDTDWDSVCRFLQRDATYQGVERRHLNG